MSSGSYTAGQFGELPTLLVSSGSYTAGATLPELHCRSYTAGQFGELHCRSVRGATLPVSLGSYTAGQFGELHCRSVRGATLPVSSGSYSGGQFRELHCWSVRGATYTAGQFRELHCRSYTAGATLPVSSGSYTAGQFGELHCRSVQGATVVVSSGSYTAPTRLVLLSDLLTQHECDTERPTLGLVLGLEPRLCMTRLHAFTIWLNKMYYQYWFINMVIHVITGAPPPPHNQQLTYPRCR